MKQQLLSGATLEVTISDIQLGYRLFAAVVRAFKRNGIELKFRENFSLEDLFEDNKNAIISAFLDVLISDEVHELIFECGQRVIYTKNGVTNKVTEDLFNDIKNREDYFEVLKTIAVENLRPFFPKALSKF